MNPENNRWEDLEDDITKDKFIQKYYGDEPESDIPIFKKGEVIQLRGYNWTVHALHEGGSRLILRALRKTE